MAMNDNAALSRAEQDDEAVYCLSRAEQEDEAARKAANPLAADIHRHLAGRYRDKAFGFNAYDLDDGRKLSRVRD